MPIAHLPADHPYVRAIDPGAVALDDPWSPGAARAAGVDAVHVHFGFEHLTPAELGRWLDELGEVALVVTVHDLDVPHLVEQRAHHERTALLVRRSDVAITLSGSAADHVEAATGRRPEVVAHPPIAGPDEVARARAAAGARDRAVVWLGTCRPNLDRDAVARMVRDPAVPLTVVARRDGWAACGAALRDELEAAVADDRRDVRVEVIERPDDAGLAALVASAGALVLPYAWGTHSGLVELATDLGVPAVVTAVGCHGDQGAIVADADELGAAAALAVRRRPTVERRPEASTDEVRRAHRALHRLAVERAANRARAASRAAAITPPAPVAPPSGAPDPSPRRSGGRRPGVSVVTIAGGRRDHLARQRGALAEAASGGTGFEHVIVDLGGEPIEPEGATVVALDVEPGRPLPLSAARNLGVRAAGGDVVILLDVDCVPTTRLVDAYARLVAERDVAWSGPVGYLPPTERLPAWDEATLHGVARFHEHRPVPGAPPRRCDDPGMLWSLSFAMSRAAFERSGGFDEGYVGYGGEDTDFGHRLRRAGVEHWFDGAPLAFHQHHPVSSPPLEHLHDLVANARRFHRRWGTWPMSSWLAAFAAEGRIAWSPDGDAIAVSPGGDARRPGRASW